MTTRDALLEASAVIARRDAETLLLHVLRQEHPEHERPEQDQAEREHAERDRAWLLAHPAAQVSEADVAQFRALTARRAAHEPLQHLTGVQEFFGLRLRVTGDTLIPRPETEHLVEAVLQWARESDAGWSGERSLRVADVGTGTGAIVIALAVHLAPAALFAIDNSAAALEIARENARAHGCVERITFVHSDLLAEFAAEGASERRAGEAEAFAGAKLDVVVSNPPYVALRDAAGMQPEVVRFEPHGALFAGEDGLAIYRRLIPQAYEALRPGGLLALEFGFGQREALRSLLGEATHAWRDVRFIDDYAGIPRLVLAERA